MALTTEQIHNTANALVTKGEKPTHINIRAALSGGSFTTISEAMKSWHIEQKEEQQLQHVELPDHINERLQSLGADVWQSAITLADERLSTEREVFVLAESKLQSEADQANEAVRVLEGEQQVLSEQLVSQQAQTDTANTTAAQLKAELESVTAKSQKEIEALKQQSSDRQHQLDLQQERTATAKAATDEMRVQRDDNRSQLKQAIEDIATYKANTRVQQAEIERLDLAATQYKQDLKTQHGELAERTQERDTVNQTLANTTGKLEAISTQVKSLATERDQMNASNNELNMAVSKLTEQLAQLRG